MGFHHGGALLPRAAQDRRETCAASLLALAAFAATVLFGSARAAAFDLDDVSARAQGLAKEAFVEPTEQVPDWLLKISYDQWRDVRFRQESALWRGRGLPFQIEFFHPGFYYNRIVRVNLLDAKGVHPFGFSPSQFDYGRNDFASKVPQSLGFAGFRVHAPIKTPDYFDEVIVFLGATYFRAVGKNEVFGLAARGLAIDTAQSSGEEFPFFREFWIAEPGFVDKEKKPGREAKAGKSTKARRASGDAKDAKEGKVGGDAKRADPKHLVVYALLDSRSVTGAYRFEIVPGEQTVVDVEARVFLRQEVKKLGIAPLTSMFYHGENAVRPFDDFRPEAHDSDGLLLSLASGEWLWRPVDNPSRLNVSAFQMTNPKGFGLVQRDRNFDHYQDLETRSDLRPSAWVVPRDDWGEGRVELIEIPTKADTNDNIVAFWVPGKLPPLGQPLAFSYTLSWYGDDATRPPAGRVLATRRDHASLEDVYRFVVDFGGKELDAIPADQVLRGVVSVAQGPEAAEIVEQHVVKNLAAGGWRLTFHVRLKKKDALDLRAYLDKNNETLTETWTYTLLP